MFEDVTITIHGKRSQRYKIQAQLAHQVERWQLILQISIQLVTKHPRINSLIYQSGIIRHLLRKNRAGQHLRSKTISSCPFNNKSGFLYYLYCLELVPFNKCDLQVMVSVIFSRIGTYLKDFDHYSSYHLLNTSIIMYRLAAPVSCTYLNFPFRNHASHFSHI